MQKFTTFIWFTGQAEAAMQFYTDVFGGKITYLDRYTGDMGIPDEDKLKGKVLTGVFELDGMQFMCLDGADMPDFRLTSGMSIVVHFDDQAELDRVWDRLMEDGKPQQCGWIADKFGVTWQIVPSVMSNMMTDPATTHEQRIALSKAMMPMVKLDGPALKAAYEAAK